MAQNSVPPLTKTEQPKGLWVQGLFVSLLAFLTVMVKVFNNHPKWQSPPHWNSSVEL
jgi:hypothetical protein